MYLRVDSGEFSVKGRRQECCDKALMKLLFFIDFVMDVGDVALKRYIYKYIYIYKYRMSYHLVKHSLERRNHAVCIMIFKGADFVQPQCVSWMGAVSTSMGNCNDLVRG